MDRPAADLSGKMTYGSIELLPMPASRIVFGTEFQNPALDEAQHRRDCRALARRKERKDRFRIRRARREVAEELAVEVDGELTGVLLAAENRVVEDRLQFFRRRHCKFATAAAISTSLASGATVFGRAVVS